MSNQINQSFRSVKSINQEFEKFQDFFLSRKRSSSPTLIHSSPHLDPKLDRNSSKELSNSPQLPSMIPIAIAKPDKPKSMESNSEHIEKSQSDTDNKKSPAGIWNVLSPNITEEVQSKGLCEKNDPRLNTLGDFSEVLQFREKENKLSNDKLFELYIKKDGGKVIPFIKKFYYKLKNATSLRDVSTLKSSHLSFLSDSTYFMEENQKTESQIKNGFLQYLENFKSIGEMIVLIIIKSHIFKKLVNFGMGHRIVIHPYQNLKILWDIVHLGVVFFWFLNIPLILAFEEADSINASESFYTIMFLSFDIFLNFNTAYFVNGVVEKSRKKIVSNYLNKKLFLDVLTMSILFVDIFFGTQEKQFRLYFNSIKLIFFLKINTIMEISHRLSEKFLLKENFQNIIALFKVLFVSIFVAHLFACFWYLVSKESQEYFDNNWISYRGIMSSPWQIKYLYSIYWACVTMMTVGYGDITPQNEAEITICLISVVLGCAVYAYNINSIGMILQDLNKANLEFDRKINIINQFMNKKNIKQDLQMRIREYLRFIWKEENTQNFEDEQKIIGLLSNSLKDELLLNAYGSILKRFPMFFANFTEKSLTKAVSIIKDIRLFPEEEIFSENNQDNLAVYFIIKGKVELVTESGNVLKELKVGDLFGEIGFFCGRPRKLSARTKDFTTLFSINRDEFINILKKNQEDFEKFCMIQDQILLYNNFFPLKIRCFCCNQMGHLANKCPLIHFQADNEKVIKKFNFYLDQERTKFIRKHFRQNSLGKKKNLEKSINAIQILIKSEEAANQSFFSSDNSILDPETLEYDEAEINEEFSVRSSRVNNTYSISEKKMSQSEDIKLFSNGSAENIKSNAKLQNYENSTLKHPDLASVNTIIQTSNPPFRETGIFMSIENFDENKSDEKRSMEKILEGNFNDKVDDIPIKDVENLEIKRAVHHDTLIPVALRSHENLGRKAIRLDSNLKDQVHEERFRRVERNTSDFNDKKYYHSLSKKRTQIQLPNPSSLNKIFEKNPSTVHEENSGIYHHLKKNNTTSNVYHERSMDYFETVRSFKNYFPENNIKMLLSTTNKRKNYRRYNKIKEERRKSLDGRLSKYTFFPEEMKMKLPGEIQKRMRMNSRKTKKSGNFDQQSNFELKPKSNKELFKMTNSKLFSKNKPKRYFTTQFLEQKFSDVVLYVMNHPNLKKLLQRNK